MNCPCGHPELHLPEEAAERIKGELDQQVELIKKHLHVGRPPCDALIEAMQALNISAGLAVVAMDRDARHHDYAIQQNARNN